MNIADLEELQTSLSRSRGILWKQIAGGGFNDPDLARATFDCYKSVDKALDLALKDLSQLPLIKEEALHAEP